MTQETQPLATPPALPAKPRKQDRTTLALLVVAALIAIGGVGFAVGRSTAPAGTVTGNGVDNPLRGRGNFPSFAPGQSFNPGQFGGQLGGAFRGAGTAVTGTVQSIDATGITVKMTDGSTVTILLTGTTTYHSETAASSGDVQAGATVRIQIATTAAASGSPSANASGQRTLTASDVLITNP